MTDDTTRGNGLTQAEYAATTDDSPESTSVIPAVKDDGSAPTSAERREARLRLARVEPWSVTRLAFVISVALMIVSVVAVTIFWTVLQATGVWGQVNDAVNTVLSNDDSSFDISSYLGLGRLVGLSLVLSAVNVVFLTALAAVGAHLYNAAAQLLGGVEVTFSDR
ncbi:hypothetical protein HMPREF0063_10423 [Aeromicrobium marinum DSM 15272]|uniref:DUF3566 domain-containing protein n=1 Tax=Aeromicrobium marinum DSM 15272 TaxID=585531 RepID=E2S8R6_9ACTN|nr:DUF3566 domain-containing protein [Aeromicrobium marinum]EFQ84571.1 hypothetical protein HMPREF0063_10423 [Aeromicrobium marinum DSM 15272]